MLETLPGMPTLPRVLREERRHAGQRLVPARRRSSLPKIATLWEFSNPRLSTTSISLEESSASGASALAVG
jgi:hypothetical protein